MPSKIKGNEQIQDRTIVPIHVNLGQLFTFKGIGVTDPEIWLNYGAVALPVGEVYFWVDRGPSNNVGLRWNEGFLHWQYSNDGITWQNIGSGSTGFDEHVITVGSAADFTTIAGAVGYIAGLPVPSQPATDNRFNIRVYLTEVVEDFIVPSWVRISFESNTVIQGAGVAGAGPVMYVESNGILDLRTTRIIIADQANRIIAGDLGIEIHTDSDAFDPVLEVMIGGSTVYLDTISVFGYSMPISCVYEVSGDSYGSIRFFGNEGIRTTVADCTVTMSGIGQIIIGEFAITGDALLFSTLDIDVDLGFSPIAPSFSLNLENTFIGDLAINGTGTLASSFCIQANETDFDNISVDPACTFTVTTISNIAGCFIEGTIEGITLEETSIDTFTYINERENDEWGNITSFDANHLWMLGNCFWLPCGSSASLEIPWDAQVALRTAIVQDLSTIHGYGGMAITPLYLNDRTLFLAAPEPLDYLGDSIYSTSNVTGLPTTFLTAGIYDGSTYASVLMHRMGSNMHGEDWQKFSVGTVITDLSLTPYKDPSSFAAYPYGAPVGEGTIGTAPATARYAPPENGKGAELIPGEAFGFRYKEGEVGETHEAQNLFAGFCLAFTAYVPAGFFNNPAYPVVCWHIMLSDGNGIWREFSLGYDPGNGLLVQYYDPLIGPGSYWSSIIPAAVISSDWCRFFFYFTNDYHPHLSVTTNDTFAVTTDAGNPAISITDVVNSTYESGIQTGLTPKLDLDPLAKPYVVFRNNPANPDSMWIGEWTILHGLRLYPRVYAMSRPPSLRS